MIHTDPRKLYQMLGVKPFANDAELKRAWHVRAKEWHPDRNKHPEAKRIFQALQEAWSVLGHPERRAAYDRSARRYVA
jgi:DnaJ homolog subfamily A member 2